MNSKGQMPGDEDRASDFKAGYLLRWLKERG